MKPGNENRQAGNITEEGEELAAEEERQPGRQWGHPCARAHKRNRGDQIFHVSRQPAWNVHMNGRIRGGKGRLWKKTEQDANVTLAFSASERGDRGHLGIDREHAGLTAHSCRRCGIDAVKRLQRGAASARVRREQEEQFLKSFAKWTRTNANIKCSPFEAAFAHAGQT